MADKTILDNYAETRNIEKKRLDKSAISFL